MKDAAKHFGEMTVINVEKRSREFAWFGSFRVTVERSDFAKCMEPGSWPQGWSVRTYFGGRKKPEDDKAATDKTGEGSGKVKSLKDSVLDKLKDTLSAKMNDGLHHAPETIEIDV